MLAAPLSGLYGRRAAAFTRIEPIAPPYAPVAPVMDQITGLPLLQLPKGFTHQTFGWSGDLMIDGKPTPTNHDGMALVTCIFQAQNKIAGNNFDNVTVSPRGGVLLCEDGGGVEDDFGIGERLMGLTPAGETYLFAKNNVMLTDADLAAAGKSTEFIKADDHRSNEWAAATFDPSGKWLFVNIQTPGITFAITGPWERGLL